MKKYYFLTCLLLCGFLLNTAAKTITVTASGITFSPSSFSAAIGDTINFVWANTSTNHPHTTTSTSVPTGAAKWDAPLDVSHTSFLYIIKIGGNYAYQCNFHVAMGMVGSFKVPPVTKVAVVNATSVNSCTSTNSVQYKCTQSQPPFKVQLFRYGIASGSVLTVSDTMPFTINNLQLGSYFATARGNNGTDSLSGKSATSALVPVPQGVFATSITSTTATIKWNHFTCVKFYTVQFRKKGTTTFTPKSTVGNKDSLKLTGLIANTIYEFKVQSKDSANRITAASKFTALKTFTTTAAAAIITLNNSSSAGTIAKGKDVLIFPNPTGTSFTIQTNGFRFISAQLRNADGVVVWSASQNTISDNKNINVNVSNLPPGTYFLQLIDINKKQHTEKIMIER